MSEKKKLEAKLERLRKDRKQIDKEMEIVNQEIGTLKYGVCVGDEISYKGIIGVVIDLDDCMLKFAPFRKGGDLSKNERYVYDADRMTVIRRK